MAKPKSNEKAKKEAKPKSAAKKVAKEAKPKKAKAAKVAKAPKAPKAKVAKEPKGEKKGPGGGSKLNLSAEDVEYIRTRAFLRERGEKVPGVSNDLSQGELATKFKCTKRSIYNVATNRSYAPAEA